MRQSRCLTIFVTPSRNDKTKTTLKINFYATTCFLDVLRSLGEANMLNLSGYNLTFDEEFNTRSISQSGLGTTWADIRSEWRFDATSDIGFGRSSFVDPASGYDPFSVSGGALTITAVPDRTNAGYPGSWESGLITTQGDFSQTYGYFEIRADFSNLPGAWDAFWLLPDQQKANPDNPEMWQELDIVEHYGSWEKGVYSHIHTTDPQNGVPWQQNRQVYSEIANPSGYHTYGMNWEEDKLSFYVDGQLVGSQATPSDMHSPMYLLVNLATQADVNNNADAAGVPISSSIDYVRVYSKDPNAAAVRLDTVSSPDGQDPGLYNANGNGILGGDAVPVIKFGIPGSWAQTADVLESHTVFGGTDYHTFRAKLAWNGVKAVQTAPATWNASFATKLAFDNFVQTDIDLHAAGANALDLMLVSAKRGTVILGGGNDHVTWVAHSNGAASSTFSTTMKIETGAGNNVVKVTAAGISPLADYDRVDNGSLYNGTYDGRYSIADVTLGNGKDSVTVQSKVQLVLHAGSGTATAVGGAGNDLFNAGAGTGNFKGGLGKDVFAFNVHAGHAVIQDFTAGADKLKFIGLTSADIHTKAATEDGVSGLLVTYDTAGDSVFLAHVIKLAVADMLFV
jgi:beta-glucanase (GH16 family)